MLQHQRTLALRVGVGSVQGRVIGVNSDTLTLVLNSPVEAIQETLGSGDAAAVATLLSTLAVTQGNAPVFNPTTIRPDLDAALTVDLVAKADTSLDWKSATCKARLILGTLRILHFRAQIRSPICLMTCAQMQAQRLMASLIQPKPRPISAVMLRGKLTSVTDAIARLNELTPAQLIDYLRTGIESLIQASGSRRNRSQRGYSVHQPIAE